ncbi:astacin [Nephila pilipes]|uniref:Metalloendopeptidase n=1 Tax=Nephila pilipes TaxID=299642 RepID=A0A8X6MR18_NEPPI|nr:astacin [Nephila pilipes]
MFEVILFPQHLSCSCFRIVPLTKPALIRKRYSTIDLSLVMFPGIIENAFLREQANRPHRPEVGLIIQTTNAASWPQCYSYVGKYQGAQPVSLGEGCGYVGTIVHELGHAIGLYHEHQRSDRDKYITVYEENIEEGRTDQFNKTEPSEELILTKYDYSSIMHYGNYAFSKNVGTLKTMDAKTGVALLEPYDKPGLNNNDIELIKKMYKCP